MQPMKPLTQVFANSDDFTVFLTAAKARTMGILKSKRCSADLHIQLQPPKAEEPTPGRALACLCYGGKFVSVTVRPNQKVDAEGAWTMLSIDHPKRPTYTEFDPDKQSRAINANPRTLLGSTDRHDSKEEPSIQSVVSIGKICSKLWELIFAHHDGRLPSGLFVVAGRTGSAKSLTARGLIHKLLTDDATFTAWRLAKKKRRPHLITLEDPIEKAFYDDKDIDLSERVQQDRQVDYTPRDKSAGDYKVLGNALNDALRQTPTVVYVGEVRTSTDWKAVLEFAGTGHFVITTTHAGSVTETLAKIFDAVKARDPEDLGRIAQRVLAVVHQSPLDLMEEKCSALIPTVWRNTQAGIAGLISEGLSSVLPHFPLEGKGKDRSSFGRRWFVRELLDKQDNERATKLFQKFDALALQKDLKGM